MKRALLVLVLLAGCDSVSDPFVDGAVAGTVRDATTRAALVDATVQLAWERPAEPDEVLMITAADSTGVYATLFRVVGTCADRGGLKLRASAAGYESSAEVVVPCAEQGVQGIQDFDLAPAP